VEHAYLFTGLSPRALIRTRLCVGCICPEYLVHLCIAGLPSRLILRAAHTYTARCLRLRCRISVKCKPCWRICNLFGKHMLKWIQMPAATKAVSSQSLKLIAVARDADIKVWSGSAYICSERSLFGGFTYIDPGARAHAQSASCLVFGFPSTSQFVSVKMLNWVLLLFQSPSWKPVSSCAA